MRMQIFRVKKPLCKILKTKNCVTFEVQYTCSDGTSFKRSKKPGSTVNDIAVNLAALDRLLMIGTKVLRLSVRARPGSARVTTLRPYRVTR